MLYITLNDMTPEYLRPSFVFRDSVNSYHLRNTENALASSLSKILNTASKKNILYYFIIFIFYSLVIVIK